jgi:hypothetical protein
MVRFALCVQLSPSHITAAKVNAALPFCHPDPDFLYVAPFMTACAAFSRESRMRFADANELHRKSGGAQSRDLQCAPLCEGTRGTARTQVFTQTLKPDVF